MSEDSLVIRCTVNYWYHSVYYWNSKCSVETMVLVAAVVENV